MRPGLVPLLLSLAVSLARADAPAPVAPDPRGHLRPDRAFDMVALRLELDIDAERRSVAGTATWTVRRLGPGPLILDQVGLTFEAVTVGGAPVPWRVERDTLVVEVPGDTAEVAVRYRATPRTGLHFRAPGPGSPDRYAEVWSQGEGEDNRHWFPAYDHPADRFTYTGRFTAPPGWKVLTNADGTDLVSYLVMLAAGPYEVVGPPENQVWAPPGTPADAVAGVRDDIPAMMAHFASRTGVPYPWGPYRQVFVQRFLYGGMENTTATVIHARSLLSAERQRWRPRVGFIVAHELAHQWYGDLLTCRDWREMWLNEGFAEYLAADWQWVAGGPVERAAKAAEWYDASLGEASLAGRYWRGPEVPPSANVYAKGASVLEMLRVMLGDETFWAAIQDYTRAHARGLVTTADLQRALEARSGMNLDWFFQQWVELPHVPRLAASWSWADGALSIRLVQEEGRPVYTLPVGIEVGTGSGPLPPRTVWMEGREMTVVVDLPAPPRWVAVDPRGGLLAEVKLEQEPAAWEAQLADSAWPYARVRAVAALGQARRVAPLARLAADAAAPVPLREDAAAALGGAGACAELAGLMGVGEPRVAVAVSAAMRDCAVREVAPALRAALARAPAADIEANLLYALGQADPPRGAEEARRRLRARRDEPVAESAVQVLEQAGTASDLPLLLDPAAPRGVRVNGWRAAMAILRRAEPGPVRERLRAQIARSAEEGLTDLDLGEREAAIAVLSTVGDAQSVVRLHELLRVETVQRLQDDAEAAITSIRGRSDTELPPTPAEVDARIRALEEKLDALESEARKRPLPP